MYYDDHLALAEKEITYRNFCCLVDAAVILFEEELRKGKSKCHRKTKMTTPSAKEEEEEEEERDKTIFQLFPRKRRTSVKNLNGASTSSSRNPFQWPSSSSPLLLHLNTIPADDSDINYPQNPKWASSSSFPGNYKIVAESENTEMRDPQNPNSQSSLSSCLTEENKSRKRRALQANERIGKSNKAKVATFSWIGRETPESLIQLMKDTNETVTKWGERSDLRLIFQRKLFKTDVNVSQCLLTS